MDYDSVVEKLREKIETLQRENVRLRGETEALSNEKYMLQQENIRLQDEAEALSNEKYTLQQENIQLRDEEAVLSNENYSLKCNWSLMTAEMEENRVQRQEIVDLTRRFEQMKEELAFIQSSNTYKVWMKYRRFPEPIRKVFRGIFAPIKMIYRGIKRVFK